MRYRRANRIIARRKREIALSLRNSTARKNHLRPLGKPVASSLERKPPAKLLEKKPLPKKTAFGLEVNGRPAICIVSTRLRGRMTRITVRHPTEKLYFYFDFWPGKLAESTGETMHQFSQNGSDGFTEHYGKPIRVLEAAIKALKERFVV